MADVNAGWFAVIGAAVGGAPTVVNSILQRGAARAQRKRDDAAEVKAERQRRIIEWRSGLEIATRAFTDWEYMQNRGVTAVMPDIVGTGGA